MMDTTTIRRTPARSPASCRFRAVAVKNAVAASWSGEDSSPVGLLTRAGHVDDALHAGQGLCQTVSGDHVHAARPRHRDDVVSPGLEHVDDVTADPPGRPRHRNLPARLHDRSPLKIYRCR